MSNNMLYTPFVGSLFDTEGFCGKRILVVGASFYCSNSINEAHDPCPYFDQCTDSERHDSSAFEDLCPIYKLSLSPTEEISKAWQRYVSFGNLLAGKYYPGESWVDVFNRISFTNYVQFVLPRMQTYATDITPRDYRAFEEALDYTKADIVIIWGRKVNWPVREHAINDGKLQETNGYLWHIVYKGKIIPVVNPYHPSFSWCFREKSKESFFNALDEALAE